MASVNLEGTDPYTSGVGRTYESAVSAVSWPAIWAGTVVAVSFTLILMALGSGIGLASVSPWAHEGVNSTTFTLIAAAWMIVVQWGSAAVGGYTTGRLRTKWAGLHTHEVFFRDTAHGLITWATATVIGALIFGAAAVHTAGHGMQAGAAASTAAPGRGPHAAPGAEGTRLYDVDRLFRSTGSEPVAAERYTEAARVLNHAIAVGSLSAEDHAYLTSLVAARSSISREEAQKRVDDIYTQMKAAEDRVRKAAVATSMYLALSMFIGAFVACAAAALGGKRRDEHR